MYLSTHGDPRQLENQLRERMRQFDPYVPIVDVQSMDEQIRWLLRTERLVASLSAVFGGLAVLLAVIGLYGVMAYTVTRRTREMGIRIALGAMRGSVMSLVMREALILIGVGLVAGTLPVFLLMQFARSQLFGVDPHDPLTLIASAVILALAASVAGFIPALHASRVDPMAALRQE